jgi:hypothetical protein
MYVSFQVKYFCQVLMTLEFSRQFFLQYSNVNFNEHPLVGVELLWTDGQTYEANKRFLQFCDLVQKNVECISNFVVI